MLFLIKQKSNPQKKRVMTTHQLPQPRLLHQAIPQQPLEDAFAKKSVIFYLSDILYLHRNKEARAELQRSLCQLYAESF